MSDTKDLPTISPARVKRVFNNYIANKKLSEKKQPLAEKKSEYNSYKLFFDRVQAGEDYKTEDLRTEYYKHNKKKDTDAEMTDSELLAKLKKGWAECSKKYDRDYVDTTLTSISKQKIRFSKQVPLLIATIADRIVEDITLHTIEEVLVADKKNLKEKFTFTPGTENMLTFRLIRDLPAWTSAVAAAAAVGEAAPDDAAADDVAAAEDEADSMDTVFNTYISKKFKELKDQNELYNKLSISKTYKTLINNLLVDFCHKLFNISNIILDFKKQKTITMDIMTHVLKICFSMHVFGDDTIDGNFVVTRSYETDDKCVEFFELIKPFIVEKKKAPEEKPKQKKTTAARGGRGGRGRGVRGGKK